MTATIDRDESWRVIDAVRTEVADLLDAVTAEQRLQPSLCDAWTVRDVAAHLSMAALAPASFVARNVVRHGFRFNSIIREATLAWSRGLSDEQVGANLRSLVGNRRLAVTTMWRDPLLDALVHHHDIARPLGITVPAHPEAAATAADWAWDRTVGFPFFAARRLRGLRLVATDVDWSRGTGDEVRGPVTDLLLLSTGRRTTYAELTGPGAERARATAAA
ncbi:MAG TPA: maleylpyruvate isomerase family mycothiol-dependent enzyme [Ornithinibacter sp.]|nr:maleylpyruvate isomerase family mycothiol-dependent enzyme [Ornithinibacter sp.]